MSSRVAVAQAGFSRWTFVGALILATTYLGVMPWISLGIDKLQSVGTERRKETQGRAKRADIRREIDIEDDRLELQRKRLENEAIDTIRRKVEENLGGVLSSKLDDIAEGVRSATRRVGKFESRLQKAEQRLLEAESKTGRPYRESQITTTQEPGTLPLGPNGPAAPDATTGPTGLGSNIYTTPMGPNGPESPDASTGPTDSDENEAWFLLLRPMQV